MDSHIEVLFADWVAETVEGTVAAKVSWLHDDGGVSQSAIELFVEGPYIE